MKKILKRFLIGFAIVLSLFIVAGILATLIFQSRVKYIFQNELNKELKGTFTIHGDADFSLFKRFPNASMSFYDIELLGSTGLPGDTLMKAGKISFIFNPFSLVSGKYKVDRFSITDAELNINIDRNGQNNYSLFDEDTTTLDSKEESFNLIINEAYLHNVRLKYKDDQFKRDFDVQIDHADLSGSFNETRYTLMSTVSLRTKRAKFKDTDFSEEIPIEFSLLMDIDKNEGTYQFKDGELNIAGGIYHANGNYKKTENGGIVDIKLDGNNISLESLIALMPPENKNLLEGFDSRGQLKFNALIYGKSTSDKSPGLKVSFDFKNGKITHDQLHKNFKEVYIKGSLDYPDINQPSVAGLNIEDFRANFDGNPLSGNLNITDFSDPDIDLNFKGNISLTHLSPLIEGEFIDQMSGGVNVRQLSISGELDQMTKTGNLPLIVSQGNIDFNKVSVIQNGSGILIDSGSVELDENHLNVSNVGIHTGNSDFKLNGKIENSLSYLANRVSGKVGNTLNLDLELSGKNLDLGEIINTFPSNEPVMADSVSQPSVIQEESKNEEVIWLFRSFRGNIDVDIEQFAYKTFQAKEVSADLVLSPYLNKLQNLRCKTADGTIEINGLTRIVDGQLITEGEIICDGLNVKKTFKEFDNFWQDYIQEKHINGNVSAVVNVYLVWDKNMEFIEDKMDISANVIVNNGELKDFDALNELSAYIRVKELEHIQFSSLRNTILIKGDRIIFPVMSIKSTAMNMWISGTHYFNDTIDYQFKLDFMDVLGRKIKVGKMKLKKAEKKGNGIFNTYVLMSGHIDDPVFETNRKKVLMKFEESKLYMDPEFLIFEHVVDSLSTERKSQNADEDEELDFIDWDK